MKKKRTDPKSIDIVMLKRKKRRRRQLLRFSFFIGVILLCVIVYVKSDDWFPKLEGAGKGFHSVSPNGDGVSGEQFPLTISGGIDYQVGSIGSSLAILSDAFLYIYDGDGDFYDERQHSYANAVMQTSDSQVLLYESGGTHFRVDSKSKNIYEKKMDNNIDFARMSENGDVAVITRSESFVCRLIVYDKSGEEKYSRDCVERIIDIDFTEDGSGCVLAAVNASDGNLVSKLIALSFDSKEDRWVSDEYDTLALKTFCTDDGIFLVGEDRCAFYSDKGEQKMSYDYPSTLVDWDCGESGLVLLFDNVTKRSSYFTYIGMSDTEPHEKKFDTAGAKCIEIAGDKILVMNKDGVTQYSFSGSDEENINSETSYDRFCVIDDQLYLMGYDRIDRVEYS